MCEIHCENRPDMLFFIVETSIIGQDTKKNEMEELKYVSFGRRDAKKSKSR